MPDNPAPLPEFTRWPSFPFEGDLRVKKLNPPVAAEPPRSGEDAADCIACNTPDDAYIWVSERWRVRAMDRPTGLPMVLILECRSHLDLGDLPNLLAAELGVMTVRLERAIRSLDGVARVHVNRWGDGSAHLHMWFLARPYGQLQLRGTFLSLWDDILPRVPEQQWRENLALVAAWLAEFGGQAIAEPPHIQWQSPATFAEPASASDAREGRSAEGDASDDEWIGSGSRAAAHRPEGSNVSDADADADADADVHADGVATGGVDRVAGDVDRFAAGGVGGAAAGGVGGGAGSVDRFAAGGAVAGDADGAADGVDGVAAGDVDGAVGGAAQPAADELAAAGAAGAHGAGRVEDDLDGGRSGAGTGTNRGQVDEGTGGGASEPADGDARGRGLEDAGRDGIGDGRSGDGGADGAVKVPRQAERSRVDDHGTAVVD